jgi:tetratricopeptide (TPR) repeat protein
MPLLIALAALAAQASPPRPKVVQVQPRNGPQNEVRQSTDPLRPQLEAATNRIKSNDPYDSLPILDKVIAAEESAHHDDKRMFFSARSLTEALLYAGMGASLKKNAVILDETWSTAYFLKAYALVDLNRAEEAKADLDKAVALAPQNAQFLAERGEWYKTRKDWNAAYGLCGRRLSSRVFARRLEILGTAPGLARHGLCAHRARQAR